ncbi:SGNH/GDSL hydrolase family protein [Ruminococcus callidus]|jgi:hypothetical protein|uniref:SGNH/GDSL hydrolase family protein n=1 Tax=Ruminococcus callidus TaxID=40519 RepID=UPI002067D59D|nr:SGNH/GDSL hydrolase family protein [Ruminococcus callidus]DAL22141.1 MAG TPA_asm: GDSL like Lipase Acylhydrolase [Caudoviricetes sp.]
MITAIIDAGQHYCQAVSDLWQWDYGQTLRIQGVKLPAAVEVQFSTTERIGETVTRIGVTQEGVTEVPIPDTLLEGSGTTQDYTIYAFVYIENGDSGKTEYRVSMKVRARPKPEAHATPEEGELFRQAIVAVAESADRAESARKSAETASDQAEDAKNAAEAAVGSAQASADEAKTAKANAKTAVKNAEAFKTEAETARSEAVRAVTESTDAKDSAEKSRAAAEKAKQDAEAAKEEIQESADQIQKNATEIDSLKEDIDNIIYKGLINGFDKDNTVGGYLSNNGNVNSNPGFVTSDYFDVHENKTYYALQMVGTVKYDTVAYICFYDSSKAFIAGGYFNASSCTSPNGSKYARVSFPSDETTKARCMFTNIETPDKYYPFGYEYSIITKDVSELKTRKSENRLHGKTMAILGDSMAKGHTLNEKQTWAYKIANRNGMTYQKLAVNGMFITTGHGDADANCLLEQAKKINNNPDIIVIHMGTNDRNNNVELGTWTIRNTDTTNLFGALRVAFTYLEENFPLAQVMFITPYYYQEQTDYIGSIEKACMYVGCHCKNNKQGGICAWNTNVRNALFLDYVHLNEVGQERVSYEYEGFMRTFM